DGGFQAAGRLLDRARPPTAIFALSDEMAFGTLVAARRRGFDVPRQLSVIGVDDHDVAEVMGLTTVRQRVSEHGAAAARALPVLLSGDDRPSSHAVGTIELVVRATTGTCA
ncbi:MAG: substrate-binding domain-containing protein, partial [Actinomycetota bacterium]|nr:substrate-binding domain-containing protein [Actinomycetota bacterium]